MKKHFTAQLLALLLITARLNAGLFNNDQAQLEQALEQIQSQREETGGWQIIAGLCGLGCVILFTVGTAIGSKVRRDREEASQ